MAADNKHKITIKDSRNHSADMKSGEIGVIKSGAVAYLNKTIVCFDTGFLILDDPSIVLPLATEFSVDILPKGTVLEIEV